MLLWSSDGLEDERGERTPPPVLPDHPMGPGVLDIGEDRGPISWSYLYERPEGGRRMLQRCGMPSDSPLPETTSV